MPAALLAPTPRALLRLEEARIAKLIYPAGFYKKKAATLRAVARTLLERHAGEVPRTLDALLALPGVGRKTANLVLTAGHGLPGICVDTHVHRITTASVSSPPRPPTKPSGPFESASRAASGSLST